MHVLIAQSSFSLALVIMYFDFYFRVSVKDHINIHIY